MRILIAFHSDTGNTKKIADAAYRALAGDWEVDLRQLRDVDPSTIDRFAVLFLATPIHAGGLSEPAQDFLASGWPATGGPALAGLVTHASSAFSSENYQRGLDALAAAAEESGVRYLGTFDCQGRLDPAVRSIAQEQQGVGDEEWARRMTEADQHPDPTDEAEAAAFARRVASEVGLFERA